MNGATPGSDAVPLGTIPPAVAPAGAGTTGTGIESAAGEISAWRDAKRILAIRLDNLGDILMSTPAIRALRETLPGRSITLLAGSGGAALAPFIPELDDVITAGAPWMPGAAPTPEQTQETVARLRAARFDAAVIFTVYSQNPLPAAFLCWLAGIPLRLAHCRENPYHLLTDWIVDPEPHEILRHEARRQLDLVAAVGASVRDSRLSFRVRPDDRTHAAAILHEAGIDLARPYAVLHPGASAASRRYPPEGFAGVADLLRGASEATLPLQLVFTGDASEAPLIAQIRALSRRPSASLAGKLALGELGAVIEGAEVLITNNTGPVHLAAALGTPVVDLYALTNPQHAPWKVPHRVLYEDVPCRYCYRSVCPQQHHACLRLLAPERVAEAARELLDRGAEYAALPAPSAITSEH